VLRQGDAVRMNPAVRVWAEALRQRMWAIEFGMTPSSRARVRIEKPAEEDALDEFLRRGTLPTSRVN
jgi:phage terminase small subunit